MCDDNPQGKEDEVARLIKEAWKRPRVLSREEVVEFIAKPVYMGTPERIPAKRRGPKQKRTQYDEAYDRRKGLYHRLVRLPKTGTTACRSKGDALRDSIRKYAEELAEHSAPQHKLVSAISRRMTRDRIQPPDDSTLRKKLRELGYRIPRK